MTKRIERGLMAAVLLASSAFGGCTDPITAAIDEALDFEGFFQASDGTEIELVPINNGGEAYIRKVGSAPISIPPKVGDRYMIGMAPTGTKGEYIGSVINRTGMYGHGTVRVGDGSLTIEWRGDAFVGSGPNPIDSHGSWNQIPQPSNPPTGGDGNGGGTVGDIVLLYLKLQRGERGSSTYHSINVPAGTKKLVVEMFEENEWGHNMGDLFVSYGTKPAVLNTSGYNYTAQCASINPNREREVCTFNNPQAGTWWILMYGYHEYFNTSIRATITK